jgi:hypothetical protein
MERNSSTLEIVVLGTQTAEQSSNGQQHDREISGDYSAFAGWRCNLVRKVNQRVRVTVKC